MSSEGLRSRPGRVAEAKEGGDDQATAFLPGDVRKAGPIKHGQMEQALRMFAFGLWFAVGCVTVHWAQLIFSPMYFINKDYYYAFMSITKQNFGLMINSVTEWFAPMKVRISAEPDVAEEMKLTEDGRLECNLPERIVLISNHQIYTDWLYLWWISYTNRMHGHLFIILKESLKYVPIIGPAMLFYGFIFLARDWTKDKPRFQHRINQLKTRHTGPMAGSKAALDPMWLLIFPEGTNLSKNGRATSEKWAAKSGLKDMRHQLLPRSTGLHFCLSELGDTVEWVYDCTISYGGVPEGEYGQDIFTLRSMYFQGILPASVNMYWRRFRLSSIPLDDPKAFELWLRERWLEKDELIERFAQTGRFPPNQDAKTRNGRGAEYLETSVKQKYFLEFVQIFLPGLCILAVLWVVYRVFRALVGFRA
ncbi:MAG: hypothetical protein M1831_003749 [Alyxoria varia]|nr:MAG: hypothetical protein M1831_003749 [Alyxoria varia]